MESQHQFGHTRDCDNREITILDKYRTTNFTFTNPHLQNTIFNNLKLYCVSEQFADITVIVDNVKFQCHRVILGASCPYFRALFLHQNDHNIIHLDEISSNGFSSIRLYIYTGQLTLDEDNVAEVLEAADYLQFRELVEVCASMLLQHIRVTNCLRIMHLSDRHSCVDLYQTAKHYCLSHFQSVIWTPDFSTLPLKSLLEFISNDRCDVDSECDILVAISRWLNARTITDDFMIDGWPLDDIVSHCKLTIVDDNDVRMCVDTYPVLKSSHLVQERLSRKNPFSAAMLEKLQDRRMKEVVVVIIKRASPNQEPWPAPRQIVQQVVFTGLCITSLFIIRSGQVR